MNLHDRRQFLALSWAAFVSADAQEGEQVIPFLDTKPFSSERPTLPWDQTTSWLTPTEHLFRVGHYGFPEVDASKWSLPIGGLVDHPRSFTLNDLRKRKRREQVITLECSGNPPAGGLVGNAKWSGTPLAPILKECGIKSDAVEPSFSPPTTVWKKSEAPSIRSILPVASQSRTP